MRTLGISTFTIAVLLVSTTGCESPFYTGEDWDIETVYAPAQYVTVETPGGTEGHPAGGLVFEWEASDPRLSGDVTVRGNGLGYGGGGYGGAPPGAAIDANVYQVVNAGGRWVGTSTGLYVDEPGFGIETVLLTGEGDYEGLSAYLLTGLPDNDGDFPTYKGLLFPGPMPTFYEPVGEPAVVGEEGGPVLAAPAPVAGPLGRSYSDWAASYQWWGYQWAEELGLDWSESQYGEAGQTDCAAGDYGDVLFAPRTSSTEPATCWVAADQRILLALTFPCPTDTDPVGCFSEAMFRDVFVSVDGQSMAIDERFHLLGSYGEEAYPGYYMMLEPLAPGSHEVEWGGTVDFGAGNASSAVSHAIDAEVEPRSWE